MTKSVAVSGNTLNCQLHHSCGSAKRDQRRGVLTLTLFKGTFDPHKQKPNPKRRTARITPRSQVLVERGSRGMDRFTNEKTTESRYGR